MVYIKEYGNTIRIKDLISLLINNNYFEAVLGQGFGGCDKERPNIKLCSGVFVLGGGVNIRGAAIIWLRLPGLKVHQP